MKHYKFRVLCYNVGNGLVRPERLARAIRESEADLIGLVELTPSQAVAVEALCDIYPYQYLNGAGIVGKGLLSRLPLYDTHLLELYPDRPDLYAYILANGTDGETDKSQDDPRKLRIIVAHPPPQRTRMRTEQLRSLLEITTDSQDESALLMGDFNMVQFETTYKRYVAAGLVDAFRTAGRGHGLTYPVRRYGIRLKPLIRLDFIWHTRQLRAHRAWLGKDQGSDHLPIFADMTW